MFTAIAAALLAVSPAQDGPGLDEPMYPFNLIIDAARAGTTVSDPAVPIATCQARYHWDEATVAQARLITMSMLEYVKAAHDVKEAGIDPDRVVGQVFASLTPEQVAAYGIPGQPPPAGVDDVIRVVSEKFQAAGITGDAFKKAHTMLMMRAATTNLLAEFRRTHTAQY